MKKLFLWLITILIIAVFSLVGCNAKAAVKEVEVDSSNPEGVKFVAPESGSYEITIVGGPTAICHKKTQIGQFMEAGELCFTYI